MQRIPALYPVSSLPQRETGLGRGRHMPPLAKGLCSVTAAAAFLHQKSSQNSTTAHKALPVPNSVPTISDKPVLHLHRQIKAGGIIRLIADTVSAPDLISIPVRSPHPALLIVLPAVDHHAKHRRIKHALFTADPLHNPTTVASPKAVQRCANSRCCRLCWAAHRNAHTAKAVHSATPSPKITCSTVISHQNPSPHVLSVQQADPVRIQSDFIFIYTAPNARSATFFR